MKARSKQRFLDLKTQDLQGSGRTLQDFGRNQFRIVSLQAGRVLVGICSESGRILAGIWWEGGFGMNLQEIVRNQLGIRQQLARSL